MPEEEENNMDASVSPINKNKMTTTSKKVANGSAEGKSQSVSKSYYQDNATLNKPKAADANEGFVSSFLKNAGNLTQTVIASVSPYVPQAVKQIYHNIVDIFSQWLGNNEKTMAVIQEAKQVEAGAATPQAKAAAKAKAGNAAKAQLKATLQIAAKADVINKTPGQIKAETKLINALSDDEAVKLFSQVDEAMQSAPNEDKFHTAAQRLDGLLKQIRQNGHPSERVKSAGHKSIATYSKKQHEFIIDREAKTATIKNAPSSAENASLLNQISRNTEMSAKLAASITESASDPVLEVPQATLVELHENTKAEQNLSVVIIQVAEGKGYKLDNFTQLASVAGIGEIVSGTSGSENAGFVVFADKNQGAILLLIQNTLNGIIQGILNQEVADNKRNEKLDELKSQRVHEENVYEQKMDELKQTDKKYVADLQDKKLADRLHANIIAVSYMLKNPEQLSKALLGAIQDEINKIKWQLIIPDR